MLAPDGRCKTLDIAADGYVRAEAVAALALRAVDSLAAAAASAAGGGGGGSTAGRCVLVRGTAVNQDGRSSSLTAPNGPAQQALLRAALQAAHLQPGSISALQAHGTGTALGDPIEINAALAVMMQGRGGNDGAPPLALGAVKAAAGHAEPAAGAVGLASSVAALESGALPQMVHLR